MTANETKPIAAIIKTLVPKNEVEEMKMRKELFLENDRIFKEKEFFFKIKQKKENKEEKE